MQTNILCRWNSIIALQEGGMTFPHFATLQTCGTCNHKCLGCAHGGKHTGRWLSYDQHFRVIDILLKNGVRAFEFCGGGEPTMMPYLPKLIEYIHSKDGFTALMTNGSNFTPDLVNALVKCGTFVRISLEASTPGKFAEYKGVPILEFSKIVSSAKALVESRNHENSKLEISVKFSISESLRGLQHYVQMFNITEYIGADRMSVKCLRHEPEELPEIERYAEYAIFTKVRPTSHGYQIVESILPTKAEDVPQCYLNPLHVVIDEDANAYLCCYYYYRQDSHRIGNILKEDFTSMWFSPEHKAAIDNINRAECAKVDCKFFKHHAEVAKARENGRIYFL